jgi:DNA-binding transcriptional LysR family regulator
MDRITALQVFTEVAERGSLTQAAEALGLSRAMVSRYLESLEQTLGARLLHRTTRRVSLSDAGADALPRCKQILAEMDELQAQASQRRSTPQGKLRMTASTSLAQAFLAQVVAEFLGLYPETQIELLSVERTVNLVEERIDLAVRIGNQLDEGLLARRLGVCRSVVVAAPAYLKRYGTLAAPEDLRHHRCLTHAFVGRTEFTLHRAGQTVKVPVHGPLQSNEAAVTRAAALAGAGVALLPTYFVGSDLSDGRLQRLLPEWEPEPLAIHAVYLSRQHQPLLLRTLLDHLASRFGEGEMPWDAPLKPTAQRRRRGPRHSSDNLAP